MAKIKKIEPKVVQPPPTYEITLTEKEAQGLKRLLCNGVTYDTCKALGIYDLFDKLDDTRELAKSDITFRKLAEKQ